MEEIFERRSIRKYTSQKVDNLTIDAVLRNIEIIGEAANKLSEKVYQIKTGYCNCEWTSNLSFAFRS
ncbi:hypothetical protein DFR79_10844 [Halanaerobium saccharolyticum]|uniref:Uncharacterized protein n=1 Tax=Halanaerobium saccharolyticum TaxID=43595 RepID=A0A4R6LTP8_9FIRM|nr:HepT-like ribonuclease domain-containing protein [Halanaerobium saccharolyticum]TDO92018.1 hypothetical protein DFR79_10844 [Halanaerobium saccharolyticum]